jgi:hypothetical protein
MVAVDLEARRRLAAILAADLGAALAVLDRPRREGLGPALAARAGTAGAPHAARRRPGCATLSGATDLPRWSGR